MVANACTVIHSPEFKMLPSEIILDLCKSLDLYVKGIVLFKLIEWSKQ